MRRPVLIFVMLILATPNFAYATDDMIPATSEDADQFDRDVANANSDKDPQETRSQKGKAKKDNFGKIVSAEAKKLKDESSDQRREFGAWVSGQRRQNDQSQHGDDSPGSSGDHPTPDVRGGGAPSGTPDGTTNPGTGHHSGHGH